MVLSFVALKVPKEIRAVTHQNRQICNWPQSLNVSLSKHCLSSVSSAVQCSALATDVSLWGRRWPKIINRIHYCDNKWNDNQIIIIHNDNRSLVWRLAPNQTHPTQIQMRVRHRHRAGFGFAINYSLERIIRSEERKKASDVTVGSFLIHR